ncbi:hypothetical protein SDC9_115555 [bioreactor metagenome]|uniref:Uncharacterized protein n=1 Tax=bioreactor metagenome TaxID=1076179 RepID=A0A645BVJ4_9ZZZZ
MDRVQYLGSGGVDEDSRLEPERQAGEGIGQVRGIGVGVGDEQHGGGPEALQLPTQELVDAVRMEAQVVGVHSQGDQHPLLVEDDRHEGLARVETEQVGDGGQHALQSVGAQDDDVGIGRIRLDRTRRAGTERGGTRPAEIRREGIRRIETRRSGVLAGIGAGVHARSVGRPPARRLGREPVVDSATGRRRPVDA